MTVVLVVLLVAALLLTFVWCCARVAGRADAALERERQ